MAEGSAWPDPIDRRIMLLTPGKHVNLAWLGLPRNHVLPAGVADPRHLIAGTLHRSRDVTTVVETISTSSTAARSLVGLIDRRGGGLGDLELFTEHGTCIKLMKHYTSYCGSKQSVGRLLALDAVLR
jgi:hypothetical protein